MSDLTIEVGYQDLADQSPEARATRWTVNATGHKWWTFTVDVTGLPARSIEAIAEATYLADNYSAGSLADDSLADRIQFGMLRVYKTTHERHQSLSVGDRVRVGEAEVVCSVSGWIPACEG